MIGINVNGQIVSVQETEPLYSGSADVQQCRFTFDKSWNGFEKSAVFRVGTQTHTKLVDEDGCCILPWEMLTHRRIGQQLEVGVYGVSDDAEIMTSVWDTLGVIREGAQPGEDTRAPGEGVYDQIMAKLGQIRETVSAYDEDVRALAQRAETAAGLAGESAQSAMEDLEELRGLVETHQGIPGAAGKSAYQYAEDGGYAGTEEEFAAKLAQENYTKNEADDRFLTGETDPSVPAWAKAATKPTYTAEEVGADERGAAAAALESAKAYTNTEIVDLTADLTAHTGNKNNPHGVTAAQLGLKTENFTFTLENGSTVTKAVYVG